MVTLLACCQRGAALLRVASHQHLRAVSYITEATRCRPARTQQQVLAQCNLRDKAYEAGRADGALAGARKALHSRLKELEAFIGAPLI